MYNLKDENGFIKKIIEHDFNFKEMEQFITEEKPEDVNKLIDYIKEAYEKRTDIKKEIREMKKQGKDTQELSSEYEKYDNTFSNCTGALTNFVLKYNMDSNYIENIIEKMPFMNRAAFINESVLNMKGKERFGQYVEYTNALDVYERNIDKEIRDKLNEQDFEKLCDELYLDAGIIGDPTGVRRMVPKYDCINFSLFRIDKELHAGKFSKVFNDMSLMGGKDILNEVYKFDRNIYEQHPPENIEEMDEEDREDYIADLYWAQKITDEDKKRLGLIEEKENNEQIKEDLKETYKSENINQTDLNSSFNSIDNAKQQTKEQMNLDSKE